MIIYIDANKLKNSNKKLESKIKIKEIANNLNIA